MSKDEQTAREQAVAAKYKTAHDLARKLLQLPDHRIGVTSAVFDVPGCFHALPVEAKELKIEGVDCIVLQAKMT